MERKIEKLVDSALQELEYTDCFIVDLKVNSTRIEVYLDSDTSITYERCRKVSRIIEAILDEEQWFGEKYTLDVSSAGIDRPLKFPRQYVKNIGRKVKIKALDQKFEGTITAADEEKISITYKERVKEGKKKKNIVVNKDIAMSDISEAKIKISFN